MSALRPIPAHTRARQSRASDPAASAWVSANAGSGKTHVLTQRVVRLLLGGAPPSRILCLTFTKAAAANMALRVFKTLAEWTRLDDAALGAAIEATGAPRPDAARLVAARRLFARAVETPGGLKIQTIHAFCEALLHRFPLEANVPARFEILDEESQVDALRRAREETLARAACDARLGEDLRALVAQTSAAGFDKALDEALAARAAVAAAAKARREDFAAPVRAALGLAPGEHSQAIERAMIEDGIHPREWARAAAALEASSAQDRGQGEKLRAALAAQTAAERLDFYVGVFFTTAGEPRRRVVTSAFERRDPALADRFARERDRLVVLIERLKAARALERTQALLAIVGAIFERYEAIKARRGWLDFDDLIAAAARLLAPPGVAWVQYKLDAGLDHVLVDEAQDMSDAQWGILRALVDEFTAGRGAREIDRTLFAVGDEKQSIYSFQGAAPHLFDAMRRFFAARHRDAEKNFEQVPLTMSFRSSRAVLGAVDLVFAAPGAAHGLSAEDGALPPPHEEWKTDLPGLVELWEPLRPPERRDPSDWRLPVDALAAIDPERILAERIAGRIASWLAPDSREAVHDETGARRIRCGDVLILVRKRGPLFEALIRALKDRRIPVAGADRLMLADHIAAMDLMAAGRAALLPQDDLTLACALKSPLIGLGDDDLIALAPGRPGSLWRALRDSSDERHREAARRIEGWRARASSSPFAFYARLLGAEGGRRDLIARLGPDASDAIDEFLALALDHDRRRAPSLAHFLHRLETSGACVKRDMEAAADSVRVMTVHAAKGLEAKIVILPDTCSAASGRHDPVLYFLPTPQGPLPVYNPRRADECAALAQARADARHAQEAEHHRLLYVALTRAEERLYVAGVEVAKGRGPGCWYDLIAPALAAALVEEPAPWSADESVRRLTHAWPPGAAGDRSSAGAPALDSAPPDWLRRRPTPEQAATPPLRPSSALAAADDFARPREDAQAARLGALTHALLQRLAPLPPASRPATAARALRALAPSLPDAARLTLAERALAVLDEPRLAPLFGPRSRAEAAICGAVRLPDGSKVEVAGVIDRLAETDAGLWIADFKSGAWRPGPTPRAYVAQLALYRAVAMSLWPGRRVRACLVWTQEPRLVEPCDAEFEEALRALSVEARRAKGAVA